MGVNQLTIVSARLAAEARIGTQKVLILTAVPALKGVRGHYSAARIKVKEGWAFSPVYYEGKTTGYRVQAEIGNYIFGNPTGGMQWCGPKGK